MVFLITIVVIGIPIIIVTLKLIAVAFLLSSNAFDRVQGGVLRFLSQAAFLFAAVGISIPVSFQLQPLLPDFRVLGDGGVGMAHNALSNAALFSAIPCGIMIVVSVLLHKSFPPVAHDLVDPFDAKSS